MSNSPQESSLVGTILDNRYNIIRELGKGGFGHTFLAENIRMPVQELCVVKQLNPPSVEPQIIKKCEDLFKKEAITLQKLGKHPSIPELKDYFTDEQHFYLVQEYIEGKTLDKVMVNATENEVIKIIEDVGNALVEVHKNNRIHRDIKPDNLILREADNKIVLIDFGAVKEITTQIINEQGEVVKTVVIGTNGYIAPEQAQGQPCYASDIYSLGIVGIEKLTGKKPITFNFDEERNVNWINYLPVGVSVSDELANILNKMTRFSLGERYNNIQQVLRDLQAIKDNNDFPENQSETVIENSHQNPVNTIGNRNLSNNSGNSTSSQPTQIHSQPSPIKNILIALSIISLLGISFVIYKAFSSRNQSLIPDNANKPVINTSKWETYTDTNNNFEFRYPPDCQLTKDPITADVGILCSQNQETYDLVVSVDLLSENKSLDQYTALLAQDISGQQSISTPVSSDLIQVADREGRKILYSTRDNDTEKQVQINLTMTNQKVYIIKFITAKPNDLKVEETTNKILNSFVINN